VPISIEQSRRFAVADPVSKGAARTATLVALPVALLVGVLVFWLLGGFGGGKPESSDSPRPRPSSTVSVQAPAVNDRARIVCRGFIAQLPGTVRDLNRRPVSAGPELNAAYGQPPIVVRCGVPAASFPPTATLYTLSGVCFYAAKQDAETVWTTVDRQVPVAVTVPNSYSGAGQWVTEFSDDIAGAVPSLDKLPAGCH
jgi:Protein of unknown function (DUF3515)